MEALNMLQAILFSPVALLVLYFNCLLLAGFLNVLRAIRLGKGLQEYDPETISRVLKLSAVLYALVLVGVVIVLTFTAILVEVFRGMWMWASQMA